MMMAPKGTRAYWFWHSRWIHVIITVVGQPPPSPSSLSNNPTLTPTNQTPPMNRAH
jgi:hypothetical protein